MNQTMLSQLQSRIDKRRNYIAEIESNITILKCMRITAKAEGIDMKRHPTYVDAWLALPEAKKHLAVIVADQKLDKRLYGMALCMDDMVRYNRELSAQVFQPVYVLSFDETSKVAFA